VDVIEDMQPHLRGRVTEQHLEDPAISTTDNGPDSPRDDNAADRADYIDEALEETFPASGPPPWPPVTGIKVGID
jgi:hypothetical protein